MTTILAASPIAAALVPTLIWTLALTALVVALFVGMVCLLAQFDGHFAKQAGWDLVPALVLIASHEPPLRLKTGRPLAAPSRAPPSHCHLVGLTEPPEFLSAALLPIWFDSGASKRA